MRQKKFNIHEVNQLIPQLQHHFQRILFHKKELAKTSRKLEKTGASPQLLTKFSNQPTYHTDPLQKALQEHYAKYQQHLFAIEELGGIIKDLELGRVEFLGEQEGETVTLVWQLGVTDLAIIE